MMCTTPITQQIALVDRKGVPRHLWWFQGLCSCVSKHNFSVHNNCMLAAQLVNNLYSQQSLTEFLTFCRHMLKLLFRTTLTRDLMEATQIYSTIQCSLGQLLFDQGYTVICAQNCTVL